MDMEDIKVIEAVVKSVISPMISDTSDTANAMDDMLSTLDRIDDRLEIMEALEHNKNKSYQ